MPGTADERRGGSPDLSPVTLGLASLGSVAATVLVSRFGIAGSLLGAALAPVVVALVREVDGVRWSALRACPPRARPDLTAARGALAAGGSDGRARPGGPAAPVEPPVAPPSTAPAVTAPPGG